MGLPSLWSSPQAIATHPQEAFGAPSLTATQYLRDKLMVPYEEPVNSTKD